MAVSTAATDGEVTKNHAAVKCFNTLGIRGLDVIDEQCLVEWMAECSLHGTKLCK